MKNKNVNNKRITTFEQHLEKQYGRIGSKRRTVFEIKAKAFEIGEIIKEERRRAKITQEQLAKIIGTKKSYISRVESGKSDIQLSTLYKIFEEGLGKKVKLSII